MRAMAQILSISTFFPPTRDANMLFLKFCNFDASL
jgi:hypothetical protein